MIGAKMVGRDLPVALSESALALGLALLAAYRLHHNLVTNFAVLFVKHARLS
jgi:hypothetical protein